MASKKVTLTTEAYDVKLASLKQIDDKLTALKGTQGEWMKKGDAAASATTFAEYFVDEESLSDWWHETVLCPTLEVDFSTYRSMLADQVSSVDNLLKELSTEWIKANRKDSDETESLKAQRSKLAEEAEAMRSVFAQVGVTDLPEVPKAPSGRSSTGGVKVNTKGIHFYAVRDDGSTQEMSPTNDTLGGIAWYVFGKGKGGVPADDVKSALKTAGWDGTLTTSQQYGPVIIAGVKASVGWKVTATDSVPAEITPPVDPPKED